MKCLLVSLFVAAQLLTSSIYASSIIGSDTFHVGDRWTYSRTDTTGCCLMMGNPIIYEIFRGIYSIEIADTLSNLSGVLYVCSIRDSGRYDTVSHDKYSGVDSLIGSVPTESTYVDSTNNTPFPYVPFFNYSPGIHQYLSVYHNDTMLAEGWIESNVNGSYLYLQKIGYLYSNSRGHTNEHYGATSEVLISHNGILYDSSAFHIISQVSTVGETRRQMAMRPLFARLSSNEIFISEDTPCKVALYGMEGGLLASGTCSKTHSLKLNHSLSRGFYIISIVNGYSAYRMKVLFK
jgi:hypothetical protein